MNEDKILIIKKIAKSRISKLNFYIKKLEIELDNKERRFKNKIAELEISISRNGELRKNIFDYKKEKIKLCNKINEYENCFTLIKNYFKLDNIDQITSYIKNNIIDRKADLDRKEKDLDLKKSNVDQNIEIELPRSFTTNRKKQ